MKVGDIIRFKVRKQAGMRIEKHKDSDWLVGLLVDHDDSLHLTTVLHEGKLYHVAVRDVETFDASDDAV